MDDNTVAFAQWGLGTMGGSETPLPDTVVSKRSRHSNAPPSSAGKTPGGQCCEGMWPHGDSSWGKMPAAVFYAAGMACRSPTTCHHCCILFAVPSGLRELLAGATPLSSGAQPTPGAAGPAAPAPTPATGAQPASAETDAQAEVVMNPQTLASKLAELAEEHDVTVEVPAVSFCWAPGQGTSWDECAIACCVVGMQGWRPLLLRTLQQPALLIRSTIRPLLQDFFKSPGSRDGLRVTLTPKSAKAKTPAAAATQEAAPASVAKSVPRTAGRSRLSQVGGAQPASEHEGAELERTQEVAVPAEVLEAAAAVSSAKKQPPSASRRRSLSRTPGTKIVIVERGTQTTPKPTPGPASAKRVAAASQASGDVTAMSPALLFAVEAVAGCAKSQSRCMALCH